MPLAFEHDGHDRWYAFPLAIQQGGDLSQY